MCNCKLITVNIKFIDNLNIKTDDGNVYNFLCTIIFCMLKYFLNHIKLVILVTEQLRI